MFKIPQSSASPGSAMKNLLKPQNDAEAQAIAALLLDHGIYAEVRSFHDTAYDGLFQAKYGWGVIRVADEDVAAAWQIVQEWKDAAPRHLPWDKGGQD